MHKCLNNKLYFWSITLLIGIFFLPGNNSIAALETKNKSAPDKNKPSKTQSNSAYPLILENVLDEVTNKQGVHFEIREELLSDQVISETNDLSAPINLNQILEPYNHVKIYIGNRISKVIVLSSKQYSKAISTEQKTKKTNHIDVNNDSERSEKIIFPAKSHPAPRDSLVAKFIRKQNLF
jgi:hypothetical protein